MILFHKCISIQIKEQNINPTMVFTANFLVLKNESRYAIKIKKWEVLQLTCKIQQCIHIIYKIYNRRVWVCMYICGGRVWFPMCVCLYCGHFSQKSEHTCTTFIQPSVLF